MNKKFRPTEHYIQENREIIGKQIREFREKKGLSNGELAEIMAINHSTISKVEAGKFAITVDYLLKFSWHLDFEVTFIKRSHDTMEN